MLPFATTWLFSFLVYLWLAAGSGPLLGLWPWTEITSGLIIATAAAALSYRAFAPAAGPHFLRPKRCLRLLAYICGPFFMEMARANIAVAIAVITGRIRPAVLRVHTGLLHDDSLTMLANSITLTPGTLSLDVDDANNDLFVHLLNLPKNLDAQPLIPVHRLFVKHNCARWIHKITGDSPPTPQKPDDAP